MNELIKINYESDRPTVLARDLHEFLEVGTPYDKWFPKMCEYGFAEGEDYSTFLSNRSDGLPGKPRQDAQLTIDMAQERNLLDPDKRRRGTLLAHPHLGHLVLSLGPEPAGASRGSNHDTDRRAVRHELREGSAGTDVGVIRVGENAKDSFMRQGGAPLSFLHGRVASLGALSGTKQRMTPSYFG